MHSLQLRAASSSPLAARGYTALSTADALGTGSLHRQSKS